MDNFDCGNPGKAAYVAFMGCLSLKEVFFQKIDVGDDRG